jgi:hypothetical protein
MKSFIIRIKNLGNIKECYRNQLGIVKSKIQVHAYIVKILGKEIILFDDEFIIENDFSSSLTRNDIERILYWYNKLNPNETAEEDFLPNALLVRKLIQIGNCDNTESQDDLIVELLNDKIKRGY